MTSCSQNGTGPSWDHLGFAIIITIPLYLYFIKMLTWLVVFLQTVFDQRFYELRITAGPNYPKQPPSVRFVSRIAMQHVNQTTGVVEASLPGLQNWTRNSTIESVLVSIKNCMMLPQNKTKPQPPEGTTF